MFLPGGSAIPTMNSPGIRSGAVALVKRGLKFSFIFFCSSAFICGVAVVSVFLKTEFFSPFSLRTLPPYYVEELVVEAVGVAFITAALALPALILLIVPFRFTGIVRRLGDRRRREDLALTFIDEREYLRAKIREPLLAYFSPIPKYAGFTVLLFFAIAAIGGGLEDALFVFYAGSVYVSFGAALFFTSEAGASLALAVSCKVKDPVLASLWPIWGASLVGLALWYLLQPLLIMFVIIEVGDIASPFLPENEILGEALIFLALIGCCAIVLGITRLFSQRMRLRAEKSLFEFS